MTTAATFSEVNGVAGLPSPDRGNGAPSQVRATKTLASCGGRTWDAVVVGAGPAGAMAAREIARRGGSVLLVDHASFPRAKVCGCCLNGSAMATLNDAGLGGLPSEEGSVDLSQLRLYSTGREARVALPAGAAVSRASFDAALVRAATAAGAEFVPGISAVLADLGAAQPDPPAQGSEFRTVRMRGGDGAVDVRSRTVIAADGLGGRLLDREPGMSWAVSGRSRFGAGVIAPDAPSAYGPGVIHMACAAHGYVGAVRLEDGRLDIAAAFDPGYVRALGGPGAAADSVLRDAGAPEMPGLRGLPWRGTPLLTRRRRRVAGIGVFAVGDAAGYVEPFTGEGIAWALATGFRVAVHATECARGNTATARAWEEEHRRIVGRRQMLCRAVASGLRWSPVRRACHALLRGAPALASPFISLMNAPPADRRSPALVGAA